MLHDLNYQAFIEAIIKKEFERPKSKPKTLAIPCRYRSSDSTETKFFSGNEERISLPVFRCRLYGLCTEETQGTSNKSKPIPCCQTCQDYAAPFREVHPLPVLNQFGDTGFVFSHGGDYGDIIYSLSAIYDLCCSVSRKAELHFYHRPGVRAPMTPDHAAGICPLILAQPYIAASELKSEPYGVQFDVGLRKFHQSSRQISDHYHNWLNIPFGNRIDPWLVVPEPKRIAPIVIARSARYHGHGFPWARIVRTFRQNAVFIGTPKEHRDFTTKFGSLPYYDTPDLLTLACVIAGADLFIGNQSCPRAIAEGLKKPVIVEEGTPPDTHFERPNAHYGVQQKMWPTILDSCGMRPSDTLTDEKVTFLGQADPLGSQYHLDNVDWASNPNTVSQHITALREIAAQQFTYPGGNGKGIVTVGHPTIWSQLFVMLNTLRATGCKIPIECWVAEPFDQSRQNQLLELDVTCIDISSVSGSLRDQRVPKLTTFRNQEAKYYALTHSRFEECLWLDPNLQVFGDPTSLLACPLAKGLTAWSTHSESSLQTSLIEILYGKKFAFTTLGRRVWSAVWPDERSAFPMFSGQACLLNRRVHWRELVLAHWMCQHSDYYLMHIPNEYDVLQFAFAITEQHFEKLGDLQTRTLSEPVELYNQNEKIVFLHRLSPKLAPLGLGPEYQMQEYYTALYFAESLKPVIDKLV